MLLAQLKNPAGNWSFGAERGEGQVALLPTPYTRAFPNNVSCIHTIFIICAYPLDNCGSESRRYQTERAEHCLWSHCNVYPDRVSNPRSQSLQIGALTNWANRANNSTPTASINGVPRCFTWQMQYSHGYFFLNFSYMVNYLRFRYIYPVLKSKIGSDLTAERRSYHLSNSGWLLQLSNGYLCF